MLAIDQSPFMTNSVIGSDSEDAREQESQSALQSESDPASPTFDTGGEHLSPVTLKLYQYRHISLPAHSNKLCGPLSKTKSGNMYTLKIVCYFTKFVVPFATKTANVEKVMWCLRLSIARYGTPYALYIDRGHTS